MKSAEKSFVKVAIFSHSIIGFFRPELKIPFGGAEVQLSLLAQQLAYSPNTKVDILTGDFGQEKIFEIEGIKFYRLFPREVTSKIGKVRNILIFFWVLRKIKPDILISSGHYRSSLGYVYLTKKILRFSNIYRISTIPACTKEYFDSLKGLGKLDAFAFKKTDAIVAQTEEQKELLNKEMGLDVDLIPSGYPLPPAGTPLNEKKFILWVGRAIEDKQPMKFLELAKSIPQLQFLMIMPEPVRGEKQLFEKVLHQAAQIKNLKIIPGIPFLQINQYFQNALILIITSKREGFPNTMIQAGLHKTPILSLSFDPDCLFSEKGKGLCAQGDEKILKQLLLDILSDDEEWNKYSQRIYDYTRKNHSLEVMTQKYKALFQRLIENRK